MSTPAARTPTDDPFRTSDPPSGPTGATSFDRSICIVAGTALVAHGLRRRDSVGVGESLAGAALVLAGATGHCPLARMLRPAANGDGDAAALPARSMVHVQKGFTVNRPAAELYAFWRRLENLPGFMEHLESVTDLGEGRSHWVARGPLGGRIEWEAEIADEEPGRFITWHSVAGSEIANSGMVRFDPAPAGRGTEVRVSLEYAPPAGSLGDTIAKLFGESPEQQLEDDLRHFKQLAEAGEVPTTAGQPSGRREPRRRRPYRSPVAATERSFSR